MESYITGATAFISLMTAWISYKAVIQSARAKARRQARVLSVDDPSVSMTYWKPKRFIWVSVVFGLAYIIILPVIVGFEPYLLIAPLIGITIGIGISFIVLRFARKEPPSRVRRTMSVTLAENPDNVMSACLDALRVIGAKVAHVDNKEGTIEAKIPLSLWTWGTLIDISLKTDGPERTIVNVSSDGVLPSVLFDFGHNARVVRRIKNHLLGM